MAGLVAAVRARELGASPVVLERGNRPGGSMLLSSGVIWRHRSLEDFGRECPDGNPELQRRIVEELDGALDWLESLGIEPVASETGNPRDRRAAVRPTRADGGSAQRSRGCAAGSALQGRTGAYDRRVRRAPRARAEPAAAREPVERG